jgi:ATP-dependent DNA helicase PIF1
MSKQTKMTAEFQAAADTFEHGEGHLFVTGKAGTGKSTLLRLLARKADGHLAVVAPTGLAAINAGGQTIHSFFRLAPKLIDPSSIRPSAAAKLCRQLKYLIIDEVSMVRADLMAAIDRSLRVNRERMSEPFGGVRLILFGDLHQLSPVMQRELYPYFEENYGGIYFFHAPVFYDTPCTRLELNEVFRQREGVFVDALNAIREGDASESALRLLNGRVAPLSEVKGSATVILTPTNQMASDLNRDALDKLPGTAQRYEAEVSGQFDESAYPTEKVLFLKQDAKVVLLRNDPKGRWVNGSLATIVLLKGGEVHIEVDGEVHEIEPVTWENSRYVVNDNTQELESTAVGKFKQYPLRLAWAMTIHKAQGLTLDSVYLDLGRGSFAHGQTYVALSRCRTLEGLRLARPIRRQDVIFDRSALGYRRMFQSMAV